MAKTLKRQVVKKLSPQDEQRLKDEEFLKLSPLERLRMHEQLRKKIWGKLYNKNTSLKGLKVTRKKIT